MAAFPRSANRPRPSNRMLHRPAPGDSFVRSLKRQMAGHRAAFPLSNRDHKVRSYSPRKWERWGILIGQGEPAPPIVHRRHVALTEESATAEQRLARRRRDVERPN